MKRSWLTLVFLSAAGAALLAQTAPQIAFDVADLTITAATANGWQSTLYVNGTPFGLTHTCALAGTVVTCTAPLAPAVFAGALTATGPQTFEVTFRDTVLGVESARSAPLTRTRPGAPTNVRFK